MTFPMNLPLKEHQPACILQKGTVRIQIVDIPTSVFHQQRLFVAHSQFTAIARKDPAVKNAMFMNVLTSATQVPVPRKDANCPIATKPALCVTTIPGVTNQPRMRTVIYRATKKKKRLVAMMSILTTLMKNYSVTRMERSTRIFLCSRTTFNCRDRQITTNDLLASYCFEEAGLCLLGTIRASFSGHYFIYLSHSRSRFTCITDGSLVDLHSLPPWVQVHRGEGFGNTPDLRVLH